MTHCTITHTHTQLSKDAPLQHTTLSSLTETHTGRKSNLCRQDLGHLPHRGGLFSSNSLNPPAPPPPPPRVQTQWRCRVGFYKRLMPMIKARGEVRGSLLSTKYMCVFFLLTAVWSWVHRRAVSTVTVFKLHWRHLIPAVLNIIKNFYLTFKLYYFSQWSEAEQCMKQRLRVDLDLAPACASRVLLYRHLSHSANSLDTPLSSTQPPFLTL